MLIINNGSYFMHLQGLQRKLYSLVQNADSRTELYQYLWLLISSPDPEEFCKHLQWLLATWKERESKFIEYFQSAYANRAGMQSSLEFSHKHLCLTYFNAVTYREMGSLLPAF